MIQDYYKEKVVRIERNSRDTIDVKRIYVEAAGDLVTGVLLSQIIYWFLPNDKGQEKLRIEKEGRLWLAKKREDWWQECCISPKQFDRAIQILRDKGFVKTQIFKFIGNPTSHITLDWQKIHALWETVDEENRGEFPSSRDGNNDIDQRGSSKLTKGEVPLTENTSKTTAKTTAEKKQTKKPRSGEPTQNRTASQRELNGVSHESEHKSDSPTKKQPKPKSDKARPESIEQVQEFCQSLDLPATDGEYMWHHWQSNGYSVGNRPIKDWRAVIRKWKSAGYMPSQNVKGGGKSNGDSPWLQEQMDKASAITNGEW